MPEVADARDGGLLAEADGAVPGAGDHRPVVGDREASADAGLVVHVLRLAGADGDLLDDFFHERRHQPDGDVRP